MMDPDAGGDTMDYFGKNVLKHWAGPEHWRLRKAIRKRELFGYGLCRRFIENLFVSDLAIGEQAAAAVKQIREKKEAFKISFHETRGMSAKEFVKEKFVPPTRGIGIDLLEFSLASFSKPEDSRENKEKEKEKREE